METRYVTVPAEIPVTVEHELSQAIAYVEHLAKQPSVKLTSEQAVALAQLVQLDAARTVMRPLWELIRERTRDSAHFAGDLEKVFLGSAIRQAFTGAKPGDVIGLAKDQWDALCESLRKPSTAYNPEVMYQLIPHVRAILDATTTRPEPAKPENADTTA